MQKIIQRPQYLEALQNFKDKKLIKIVTGIRRCGKSTLFRILNGLRFPSSGQFLFDGKEITEKSERT